MKFSERMYPKIILKFAKNEGFTLSVEDTLFQKPQAGKGGQIDPHPPAVLGLISLRYMKRLFYNNSLFISISYRTVLSTI